MHCGRDLRLQKKRFPIARHSFSLSLSLSHTHTHTHTRAHTHTHTHGWGERQRDHTMPGRPFSHLLYTVIQLLFFPFSLSPLSLIHFKVHIFFLDVVFSCMMGMSVIYHRVGNIGQTWGIGLHSLARLVTARLTRYTNSHTHHIASQ